MAAFFIIFAMNPSHRDTLPWTPLDTKPSSSQTLFNFRGVAWKMSPLQFSHSHNSNKKKKKQGTKAICRTTQKCHLLFGGENSSLHSHSSCNTGCGDAETAPTPPLRNSDLQFNCQRIFSDPRKIDSRHTSQCSRALKTTLAWWGRGRAVHNEAATLSRCDRDVVNLEMLLFHSIPWCGKRPNANNRCRRTSGKTLPVAFVWPQPCLVHTSAVVLKEALWLKACDSPVAKSSLLRLQLFSVFIQCVWRLSARAAQATISVSN